MGLSGEFLASAGADMTVGVRSELRSGPVRSVISASVPVEARPNALQFSVAAAVDAQGSPAFCQGPLREGALEVAADQIALSINCRGIPCRSLTMN